MALTNKQRTGVAGLVLAASTLVGLALSEGYREAAYLPMPNDRPTLGFGATFNADGSPVRMGDKTTPQRAMADLLQDAGKFERAVKRCAPVPMYPYEFSAMVKVSYNIGEAAFCNSTMARRLNALDYEGACNAILMWDKMKGRTVRGLTLRRQAEFKECTRAAS